MSDPAPTRLSELEELYAYNAWATDRILDRAAELSDEELHRDLESSFPSVRDTLAHILESEDGWVDRWQGRRAREVPDEWDLETVAGLRAAWAETRARQNTFLDSLGDSDLDDEVEHTSRSGDAFAFPLWQMLRHVVNHSSYHRGQVVTFFRQLGHDGVKTDLVHYYRVRNTGT